jgi:hypothetical protein
MHAKTELNRTSKGTGGIETLGPTLRMIWSGVSERTARAEMYEMAARIERESEGRTWALDLSSSALTAQPGGFSAALEVRVNRPTVTRPEIEAEAKLVGDMLERVVALAEGRLAPSVSRRKRESLDDSGAE